jgi:heme A synthase
MSAVVMTNGTADRGGVSPSVEGRDTRASAPSYHAPFHMLTMLLAGWAFLVICLGGTVKSREAGLTIPQPLYYQWHYDWLFIQNLNTEYIHRALVPILTVLTLLVVGHVFFRESRRSVRTLAAFMFAGLFAQAFLGYLTVKYFAHAQTSIPHAVLGQTFFCLAVAMAIMNSKSWLSDKAAVPSESSPSLCRLGVYCVVAVGVQLLLGAALRHDDQGAALRNGRSFVFVWHLIAHIAGALAVVHFVVKLLIRVFRQHREQPEIMQPARALMMLLAAQFLLGPGAATLKVLTLDESNTPPLERVVVATVHLAVGALILACCVVTALRAKRFTAPVLNSRTAGRANADGNLMGATA